MTNAMIIMGEQIRLLNEGVLKLTGRKIQVFNVATQQEELIDEIQPIHTYNGWKSLGYQVKKGEKAIAKFPVWKYTNKKKKEESEEDAQAKGYCFMKMSAFFTNEQVEEIKEV